MIETNVTSRDENQAETSVAPAQGRDANVTSGDVPRYATAATAIIAQWLRSKGYDGLCNPDAWCGCGLDDLCPCDAAGNLHGCVAAYEGYDMYSDRCWYIAKEYAE